MEKLSITWIINQSREKLENKDSRQMAIFHTGVAAAAALVLTALQYLLAEEIGKTSGLSGMGTRSVLETVQTVLQWANMVLTPFWSLGFLYAALRWARDSHASRSDLLTGFHRWGPCLGLMLNRAVLTICVLVLCTNISSMIYMMTPASEKIAELAMESGADMEKMAEILGTMSAAQMEELLWSMAPLIVIWAVASAAILLPLLYRFRMAEFVILDEPRARGLSAMLISGALLRRRCWQLFRLDLHFWWYYVLKALCLLICYADLLLAAFGISLPIGEDAAYLLTFGLYLIALFAVEVSFRPQVDTAYAVTYEGLKAMGPQQKKPVEQPERMPWDED